MIPAQRRPADDQPQPTSAPAKPVRFAYSGTINPGCNGYGTFATARGTITVTPAAVGRTS